MKTNRNHFNSRQGLYDPSYEHDACGVGMLVNIHGEKSHDIIESALKVLENMRHRGAEGADNKTGDGAGILLQIPHEFILLQGIPVPEKGKYVYEAGLTQKNKVTLETLSGIKELQLKIEREEVTEVTVDMGMPAVGEMALEVEAGGEIYTGTVISMGNPHLVIFVDEMDQVGLASVGPLLECLPLFPDRTNVEFVQVLKPDEVRMRVWERGSGITQACGTGACATAVAGVVRGKTKRKTKVIMDGGPLTIEWDERSGKVFMTGGAVNVFEGFIKV